jgi:hypothetical protein
MDLHPCQTAAGHRPRTPDNMHSEGSIICKAFLPSSFGELHHFKGPPILLTHLFLLLGNFSILAHMREYVLAISTLNVLAHILILGSIICMLHTSMFCFCSPRPPVSSRIYFLCIPLLFSHMCTPMCCLFDIICHICVAYWYSSHIMCVVYWYSSQKPLHRSENTLVRGGVGTRVSNLYTAVDTPAWAACVP